MIEVPVQEPVAPEPLLTSPRSITSEMSAAASRMTASAPVTITAPNAILPTEQPVSVSHFEIFSPDRSLLSSRYRCKAQQGEDAEECEKYAKYYRSLCPTEWVEKWNEEREAGTWPGRY